ncbi:hypothetical protein B296_00056643, partial [Ensete ventricosum]
PLPLSSPRFSSSVGRYSTARVIAPESYSQWDIFKRSSVLAILVPAKEHHHAPPQDVKPGPVLPRHREAAFLPRRRRRRLRIPLAMSPPQRSALAHDLCRPPRTKPSPLDRGEVWTRDPSPPALEGQGRRERREQRNADSKDKPPLCHLRCPFLVI